MKAIGYEEEIGTFPRTFKDFTIVLKGPNQNGSINRIIITSATDTTKIIKKFKDFYDKNGNYDILISSVRDNSSNVREEFFRIMNISAPKDDILEIPLAKITKRGKSFKIALDWYRDKIDSLIDFIIERSLLFLK